MYPVKLKRARGRRTRQRKSLSSEPMDFTSYNRRRVWQAATPGGMLLRIMTLDNFKLCTTKELNALDRVAAVRLIDRKWGGRRGTSSLFPNQGNNKWVRGMSGEWAGHPYHWKWSSRLTAWAGDMRRVYTSAHTSFYVKYP